MHNKKISFFILTLTLLGSIEARKKQTQKREVVEEDTQIIEVMPRRRPEIPGHLIKAVNSIEEFDEIINSTPLVFVDFWSKSCGICELMKPDIQELSLEYKDKVTFLSVNLGLAKLVSLGQTRYKVSGLPTYLLMLNGKRYESLTGSQVKEGLRIYIDKMIKQAEKEGVKPTASSVKPGQTQATPAKEEKASGKDKKPITITIESSVAMDASVVKSGTSTVIKIMEK